jgi:poly(hydroxyalkanoate) depolymerase family esterase
MKIRSKFEMSEVLRLTKTGRLGDAVALLRGLAPTNGETAPNKTAAREGTSAADVSPKAWRALFDRNPKRGPGAIPGLQPAEPTTPSARPLPNGARFEERAFNSAVGGRTYKLYVPSGYHGRPLPLVVMLHGCTQSPDDFAAGTRMNEIAEEQGFVVAYPRQTQADNASKCWNWFRRGDQRRGQGEPAIIAGIARQIISDFAVDGARVYVAGLSAGGAAAAIMGATYPDIFAAVGVHSGLAPGAAVDMASAFTAMKRGAAPIALSRHARSATAIPTIVFHGDADRTVNPINGDQVIAQAKAGMGLVEHVSRGQSDGGISYMRTVEARDDGQPVMEHWTLHGAGHAWSGGSPEGTYTDPRGPDASREMVRFFLAHTAVAAPEEELAAGAAEDRV